MSSGDAGQSNKRYAHDAYLRKADFGVRPLRAMTNGRVVGLMLLAAMVVACGGCDRSITHGADGEREWARRLAAAVPLSTPADSALVIMKRNGFDCQAGADSAAYLWCEKESGGRTTIVRRRWRAVLGLDARQRVFVVRASTGLIGP